MSIPESTSGADLKALIHAALAQAQQTRQRRTLVIAGEVSWCREIAVQTMAQAKLSRVTWLSTVSLTDTDVLPMSAAKTLLGQERDAIVFDAHAGFDADAFGAVSGVVCGGGLLLLLCPPLARWEQFADPATERIAIWPHSYADISGRFLRRLVGMVRSAASSGLTLVEQDSALPVLATPTESQIPIEDTNGVFCSEDQRAAVAAIEQVACDDVQRPLVLVADRGRGKTSALGIAAAQLLQKQSLRIVVTAPRPAAVQPLFTQAQSCLPEAVPNNNRLQWGEGSIHFVAPDLLCASDISADLLLVDEAAAIPAYLLQQLLVRYPRIVFSTTTHGYEGTGRGFAVRFKHTLNKQAPGWRELNLFAPVRWAKDDPLERLVFDMLLLDATCADDDSVAGATVDNVTLEKLNRDELANNEALLSQLFGLLVVAHYRTRPNDLRNLLDGPGLSVYVSRFCGQVVATALLAAEGGFDESMADAIYAGRRRPRGHLLPQSLTTHAGLKSAAGLASARVMRIAVHPAVQRSGLGGQLLRFIKSDAKAQGCDLFGTSFGATAALLRFWQREKILPVRVGFRRGYATGEHSVLMLSGLSAAGEKVCAAARARFTCDLPRWLADPLRDLDAAVATCLAQDIDDTLPLELAENHDREMLMSFVKGERTYEDALAPICRLLEVSAKQLSGSAEGKQQAILLAKVQQKRVWADVADEFALAGKAEVLVRLREAVSQLLGTVKVTA